MPVARRIAQGKAHAKRLQKDGIATSPIVVDGRAIATSFWGKAWCKNLEAYSDYENRLPRGRAYVRRGSVIDLQIQAGVVDARVSGSRVYRVRVELEPLVESRWEALVAQCSGRVGSLVDLLQGRFADSVMELLVQSGSGLFPAPRELKVGCTCPDWATICKHVAAVLYGIGARFDREPELFFTLRGVNGADLIAAAAGASGLAETVPDEARRLTDANLAEVFGIDLDPGAPSLGPPDPRAGTDTAETGPRNAPSPAVTPSSRPEKRTKRERGTRASIVEHSARGAAAKTRRSHAQPKRQRAKGDGFAAVFGPGRQVTPALLLSFGIPRTTFGNWVTTGVLEREGHGVYRTTSATLARVRAVLRRLGLA